MKAVAEYLETRIAEGDFPGDAEVQAQGEAFCTAEFEAFVGIPYDDSALYLWPLTPTQAGLDQAVSQAYFLFWMHDLNLRVMSADVKNFVEPQSWWVDFSKITVTGN